MSWKCGICNKEHDALPMDIAYAKPQHYFEIPEEAREKRSWFDQSTNPDLCVIDGTAFLIRGILPIPVEGSQEFRHGVWVLVDRASFEKYLTFKGDGSNEPPFEGTLSSEIPGYPATFQLAAEVQLLGPSDRPKIRISPCDHPLAVEQETGISMSRVHELVRAALPSMFEQTS